MTIPGADKQDTSGDNPVDMASNADMELTVSLGGYLTGVSVTDGGFSYYQQDVFGNLTGVADGESPAKTTVRLTAQNAAGDELLDDDGKVVRVELVPTVGYQSYLTSVPLPPELADGITLQGSYDAGESKITVSDSSELNEGMYVVR